MLNIDWRQIFDRLICCIYPPRCVICDDVVSYDNLFCEKCSAAACGRIFHKQRRQIEAVAAFNYSAEMRKAIWQIKDSPSIRMFILLAQKVAEAVREHWPDVPFDIVVPVPMRAAKRKERGYNQAELLAEEIAAILRLRIISDALVQSDDAKTQHELSSAERAINAEKSYRIASETLIAGKTILLIDDVCTTAATISVCAGILLDSGAKSVYAATAAATPAFAGSVDFPDNAVQ